MPWKKQRLTGRLVNGYNRIDVIPVARGFAGVVIISVDGLVSTVYDEAADKSSKCSIFRSRFARLAPTGYFLSGDELGKYLKIFSEAINDVYGLSVDIRD